MKYDIKDEYNIMSYIRGVSHFYDVSFHAPVFTHLFSTC